MMNSKHDASKSSNIKLSTCWPELLSNVLNQLWVTTRQHFLVECQALSDERRKYFSQFGVVTDRLDVDLSCPDIVTHLILDMSYSLKVFPILPILKFIEENSQTLFILNV